jgi:hypothetical protein
MQVHTGIQFWPLDPRPGEVDPRDIIHALSMMPRFGGHTAKPYSVAQHSVSVSCRAEDLARSAGLSGLKMLEVARWGLIHDAAEAYLVDVPRPVKRFLTNYQEIEAGLMAVICARFGMPREMPSCVHQADEDMLATEAALFFPMRPAAWNLTGRHCPACMFPVVDYVEAKAMMGRRWRQLGMDEADGAIE